MLAHIIIQSTFDVKFVLWKEIRKYDFVDLVNTWVELSFNMVQFEYKTNHGSNVELTLACSFQCTNNKSKGMFLGGGFYTCQNTKPSKCTSIVFFKFP